MSDLINDRAIQALRYALNGLSMRQQAIADNIANLNTPGYKAVQVSFESELQRQLQTGGPGRLVCSNPKHLEPEASSAGVTVTRDTSRSMRLDGNNVDIDLEMARLAETVINYNTVSELVSMKLAILKNVISSR
ncbi:MAG: flagellar basal body rod protein FlgB [Anaerolineae bacterium]